MTQNIKVRAPLRHCARPRTASLAVPLPRAARRRSAAGRRVRGHCATCTGMRLRCARRRCMRPLPCTCSTSPSRPRRVRRAAVRRDAAHRAHAHGVAGPQDHGRRRGEDCCQAGDHGALLQREGPPRCGAHRPNQRQKQRGCRRRRSVPFGAVARLARLSQCGSCVRAARFDCVRRPPRVCPSAPASGQRQLASGALACARQPRRRGISCAAARLRTRMRTLLLGSPRVSSRPPRRECALTLAGPTLRRVLDD